MFQIPDYGNIAEHTMSGSNPCVCGPSLYLYGLVSTIASVGYKSIRESDLDYCRVSECSVGELCSAL